MLAITLVPWAVGSEIIGRRKVMMISLFLLPVIGVAMVFAGNLFWLTIARALMGAALAGFAAVAVAYMAEEFTPTALMLAVGSYISANSLGGISGRLYGGFMTEHFGWQAAVIGMAIFSLFGALLVNYLLPQQQHFVAKKGQLKQHTQAAIFPSTPT